MPGVEVGRHVPASAAGRVVLDDARRVEPLRQLVALPHPLLRLRQDLLVLGARLLRAEAPLLVEEHPGEDRRVIEVTLQHAAQRRLPLPAHVGVRFAPAVRHVGHHQHAQAVGPVELARHLDLDVGADGVEAQATSDQDLLAHRLVAGPVPEAVRVPGLVEGHLQVDRLAVERDVGMAGAGQRAAADRAQAEVGLHPICGVTSRQREHGIVKVRVLERPRPRRLTERQRQFRLASTGGELHERFGSRVVPARQRDA